MKKLFFVGLLILLSVGVVFAQEKVLDAVQGLFIYLKGTETEISEEEYLNYAIAMQTSTYTKYINDEFEWHDQFQILKGKFDESIAAADFSSTYQIVTNVNFGDYDFDKEGFPIIIEAGSFFPLGLATTKSRHLDSDSVFRKQIAFKLDSFEDYNFFAMPKDTARTFLQGRKNRYGEVNRALTLQINYKIAAYDSPEYKNFEKIALNNNYLPVVGIIESIVVYDTSNKNDIKELGKLTK